ncbi:MAG: carboxypeptidase regulatory-like domain-containing protein [Longimicrobiaceae bacterium]
MIRTHWQSIACAIAALAAATPAAAQRVTLSGQVVDAASGQPVSAATVEVRPRREKALTDAQGRFTIRTTQGEHVIVADALGYGTVMTPVTLSDAAVEVDVALEKNPVLLQGIVATASRLKSRRNSYPYAVRSLEANQIASSGAPNMELFVRERMGVYFTSCSNYTAGRAFATQRTRVPFALQGYQSCVYSRGGSIPSAVYVDEVRMPDPGVLSLYSPSEVAAVEVYQNGGQIRVYTRWFMEWAARTNYRPLPLHVASL